MKFSRPFTLAEIAGMINAEMAGDPNFLVTGLNEIHMVEPGDMTFVDHPKYYAKALESRATTILINKKVECPEGKALLISSDPFVDFNKIINTMRPFEASSTFISPTAEIGEGTVIQPGAFIGNHVKIGKNCLIHPNVNIYDHCILGDNVVIHANTVIGADAFYFQRRKGETIKFRSCGRVILGNHVEIGALCCIDRGVTGDTVIGDYTKLDNQIQIGHDTIVGKQCLFAAQVVIAGVTKIEDEVILWGRVSINKDLTIGKGAVVLACSGVSKNLEGGKTYYGTPVEEARKAWREQAKLKELLKPE